MRILVSAILCCAFATAAAGQAVVQTGGSRYHVTCDTYGNCTVQPLSPQVIYLPPRSSGADASMNLLQQIEANEQRAKASKAADEQVRLLTEQNALLRQLIQQLIQQQQQQQAQFTSVPPAASPAVSPRVPIEQGTPGKSGGSALKTGSAATDSNSPTSISQPNVLPSNAQLPAPPVEVQPSIAGCRSMGEIWAEYPFVRESADEEKQVTDKLLDSIASETRRRGGTYIRQKPSLSEYTRLRVSAWAYKCHS